MQNVLVQYCEVILQHFESDSLLDDLPTSCSVEKRDYSNGFCIRTLPGYFLAIVSLTVRPPPGHR